VAEPSVTYTPLHGATVEGESAVLSSVYRLVLDARARKGGRPPTNGPDAAKEIENACDATAIIQQRST
jgi:hypothetical protein